MTIGRVPAELEVPQALVLALISRLRARLGDLVRAELGDQPHAATGAVDALERALDLELATLLGPRHGPREPSDGSHDGLRERTVEQLASGLGHELRSPLAVIASSVFLARQRAERVGVTDEKLHRHLDKITTQVRRADVIISQLMDLARRRPPRRKLISVSRVFDLAVEGAALPAGAWVCLDADPELTVNGDPEQLAQALVNLLVNAMQATGGRGRIWLEGWREDGSTTALRVRDDGPGVAHEQRERIFELLHTTKPYGSGLGLPLCRRIADAHGGTLELEPPLPDTTGACFVLRVPDVSGGEEP